MSNINRIKIKILFFIILKTY